jgi:hypothetical protein
MGKNRAVEIIKEQEERFQEVENLIRTVSIVLDPNSGHSFDSGEDFEAVQGTLDLALEALKRIDKTVI